MAHIKTMLKLSQDPFQHKTGCHGGEQMYYCTGNSLINAFDRLEVLEYRAKSIIMSRNIGCFSPVPDKEIAEIIKAFNL